MMTKQGALALKGGNERCLMERLETAFNEYDGLAMTARDVNELYTAILATDAADEMWAWFQRQEGGAE